MQLEEGVFFQKCDFSGGAKECQSVRVTLWHCRHVVGDTDNLATICCDGGGGVYVFQSTKNIPHSCLSLVCHGPPVTVNFRLK